MEYTGKSQAPPHAAQNAHATDTHKPPSSNHLPQWPKIMQNRPVRVRRSMMKLFTYLIFEIEPFLTFRKALQSQSLEEAQRRK
jgi:hypothetical protein